MRDVEVTNSALHASIFDEPGHSRGNVEQLRATLRWY
jgi:hypothetical protein